MLSIDKEPRTINVSMQLGLEVEASFKCCYQQQFWTEPYKFPAAVIFVMRRS